MAVVLRKAILEKTEEGVKGQMLLGHVPPFDTQFKDTPDSHVALSTRAGPATVVAVRIFDLISGLIVVTEQPNRYPQTAADHFYICDPTTGVSRDGSYVNEVARRAMQGQA
jgi:hypothetical protein